MTAVTAPIDEALDEGAFAAIREEEHEHEQDARGEEQHDPDRRRDDPLRGMEPVTASRVQGFPEP